jgi:hypothetical protein
MMTPRSGGIVVCVQIGKNIYMLGFNHSDMRVVHDSRRSRVRLGVPSTVLSSSS